MTFKPQGLTARIGIKGTLLVKRANGEIKEIQVNGEIPLSRLGLTEDQAREIVQQQEKTHERDQ